MRGNSEKPPKGFPSWGVKYFFDRINERVGGYYRHAGHMTRTLKKYGFNWTCLDDLEKLAEAESFLSDHARRRRREKLEEAANRAKIQHRTNSQT